VFAGTDRTIELAKKYRIKTAFGTDILFSAALAKRQGELLAKFAVGTRPPKRLSRRQRRMPNCSCCRASAILIRSSSALSSKVRSPISCLSTAIRSPTSNFVADPAKNLVVIMKDGRIYKNLLDPSMALSGK
jgi:hypothetical protein